MDGPQTPAQPFGRPAPDPVTGPILPPRDPAAPRRPPGAGSVAVVHVYQKRDMRVVWPGGRTTGSSRGMQRPTAVHDVDLGMHRATFSTELPAGGGGALNFPADIDIEWRVVDPALVVSTNLRDVARALEPKLQRMIRRVASQVSAMSPSVAEELINDMLETEAARRAGEEFGLEIRVYARLNANNEVIDVKNKVLIAKGDGEVADVTSEQVARRAASFAKTIAEGDLSMAALLMASHPDSMQSVMQTMWDQRAISRHETVDFINRLIGSGLVEKHEISDQIRVVMAWMQQATSTVVSGPEVHQAIGPGSILPIQAAAEPRQSSAAAPGNGTLRPRRRMENNADDDYDRPAPRRPRGRVPEDENVDDDYPGDRPARTIRGEGQETRESRIRRQEPGRRRPHDEEEDEYASPRPRQADRNAYDDEDEYDDEPRYPEDRTATSRSPKPRQPEYPTTPPTSRPATRPASRYDDPYDSEDEYVLDEEPAAYRDRQSPVRPRARFDEDDIQDSEPADFRRDGARASGRRPAAQSAPVPPVTPKASSDYGASADQYSDDYGDPPRGADRREPRRPSTAAPSDPGDLRSSGFYDDDDWAN